MKTVSDFQKLQKQFWTPKANGINNSQQQECDSDNSNNNNSNNDGSSNGNNRNNDNNGNKGINSNNNNDGDNGDGDGDTKSRRFVLNWSLFARREPRLEAAHLVPTVVFGRGALLVRRAAAAGEEVAIFCPVGVKDKEKGEREEDEERAQDKMGGCGTHGTYCNNIVHFSFTS